jgi:hypothetical protein
MMTIAIMMQMFLMLAISMIFLTSLSFPMTFFFVHHSEIAVISALNLLRVTSRWASVTDLWRLHHSSGARIGQLQAHNAHQDSAADIDVELLRFVSSGRNIGEKYDIIDTVLLQLYVWFLFTCVDVAC